MINLLPLTDIAQDHWIPTLHGLVVAIAWVVGAAPAAVGLEASALFTLASTQSFGKTVRDLERLLKEKGFTIFAKVDHRRNARQANLELAPNTVFIFGSPEVGTPLMQARPQFGIDLPVKMLVYKKGDDVWISFNNPTYLAKRHGVSTQLIQLSKMQMALSNLARLAGRLKPNP